MNIIGGLTFGGLILKTEDNFNSIPGLSTWLDSRERVMADGAGKVAQWGDKSAQVNNFVMAAENRKPTHNGVFIDFNPTVPQGDSLNSPRRDFKFLHNGSAFGLYSIFRCNILDFAESAVSLYDTSANSDGFNVLFSGAQNGRISIQARNAGAFVRAIDVTNVATLNPGNNIVLFRHVFKGINVANNHIVQYNNTLSTLTSAAANYGNNSGEVFFAASNANIGKSFMAGLILAYNWTGATQAQITEYDSRVMALLNKEKLVFEQLNAQL